MAADPLGINSGDSNLYRYVQNMTLTARDPSGLVTEREALGILKAQIRDWRDDGWNFPANLLQWFIDKKGARPYKPTPDDVAEVKQHSEDVVRFVLKQDGEWSASTNKISLHEHVFITDTLLAEGRPGYMFYTYGGFDIDVKGKGANARLRACDASLTIKLSDSYDFSPNTFPRLWFKEYNMAHLLQIRYKYKAFTHSLTFSHAYTGLIVKVAP
jgi:hypothetical protein